MANKFSNSFERLNRRVSRMRNPRMVGTQVPKSDSPELHYLPIKFIPPYEYDDYMTLEGDALHPYVPCPEAMELEGLPLPSWGDVAVKLGITTKAEVMQAQWNWIDIVLQQRRTYIGIGARCNTNEEGQVVINEILDDSPAAKAGLQIGDIILEVNKESVAGLERDEVCKLVRGAEVGSNVSITVLRKPNNEPVVLEFSREVITPDREKDIGLDREPWVSLYQKKRQECQASIIVQPGGKSNRIQSLNK